MCNATLQAESSIGVCPKMCPNRYVYIYIEKRGGILIPLNSHSKVCIEIQEKSIYVWKDKR